MEEHTDRKPRRSRWPLLWTSLIVLTGAVSLYAPRIRDGLAVARRRWEFERYWRKGSFPIKMEDDCAADAVNYARVVTGRNTLILADYDALARRRVNMKAQKLSRREVVTRIAAATGLRWHLHGGDLLLLYDPDCERYRNFLRGGLVHAARHRGREGKMARKMSFCFLETPADSCFIYMAGVSRLKLVPQYGRVPGAKPVTVRLGEADAAQAWDIVLRLAGVSAELRGDTLHLRAAGG